MKPSLIHRLALVMLALLSLASFQTEETFARLRIRTGKCECQDSSKCLSPENTRVSMTAPGPLGWPITVRVRPLFIDKEDGNWQYFQIPVGCDVAISVFAPPHALVERKVHISSADERIVEIQLPVSQPLVTTYVNVVVPESSALEGLLSEQYPIRLMAPLSGHYIGSKRIHEAREGWELPVGSYDFEVCGDLDISCANGAPYPEDWTRSRIASPVSHGTTLTIKPELGSRLKLHVQAPRPQDTFQGFEHYDPEDKNKYHFLGVRYRGNHPNLLHAKLISLEDEHTYELTWTFSGLDFVYPWMDFPMGQDVEQLVPVPTGKYELLIRGHNMQEYRQEVTMGPERTTSLRIIPKQAVTAK